MDTIVCFLAIDGLFVGIYFLTTDTIVVEYILFLDLKVCGLIHMFCYYGIHGLVSVPDGWYP